MINSNRLKTALLLSGVCFTLVFLFSCSGNDSSSTASSGVVSHDGTNMSIRMYAPSAIAALAIDGLHAEAVVDGTVHSLKVDSVTNTVSGTIERVPVGEHNLQVNYFVTLSEKPVVLCRFSTTVVVKAGQETPVTIPDEALDKNFDEDKDGYTNLAEVRSGTNPLSNLDFPGGGSPIVIAGGGITQTTTSQNYTIKQIVGSAVAGSASSASYEVIVPFVGYE